MKEKIARPVTDRFLEAMKFLIDDGAIVKTKQEFAAAMKMHASTITLLEKQERNVTVGNLITICKEFDISPEWILLGIGTLDQPSTKNLQAFNNRLDALEKAVFEEGQKKDKVKQKQR